MVVPLERLRSEAETTLDDLRRGLARAGFFQQKNAYRLLADRCVREKTAWAAPEASLPEIDRITGLLETLGDQSRREFVSMKGEDSSREGAGLLRRAEDCLSLGFDAMALVILRRIVEEFPESASATRAAELMIEIEGDH